ncbi:MAG: hypothetical protein JNM63_00335 [Spirochaetia bacterium]|nr:hypothetical protein [Spirochaetia bacterium]
MSKNKVQTYQNHYMPLSLFFYTLTGVPAFSGIYFTVQAVLHFSWDRVVLALAFAVIAFLPFYSRRNARKNQDRIIRLEMQVRLAKLLPKKLSNQIESFSLGQLIALRFAGDAELPKLTEKVLKEGIRSREKIKQLIKDWKADHLRV